MLLPLALLTLPQPAADAGSLLGTVPDDAYALVHCRDVASLRARAERNDWYRLLASPHGERHLDELAREVRAATHADFEELLAMAAALEGEAVFFDTGAVAGFVTEPPADRVALVDLVREWMPAGDVAAQQTLAVGGGSVLLAAWPDELDGWAGRAGHFAAFVDHPRALAIYSGDDADSVLAALTEGVRGLDAERRAPVVSSYLAAGGARGGGVELFVDLTPLVDRAEAALKDAVEGVLPDPTDLLGLEEGTWLHAGLDVFPGTRIEGRGALRLPPDTLAARLADTFQALPPTLTADLPRGIWGMWALNWNLRLFYERARAALEAPDPEAGLAVVDAGLEAARAVAGVDPVVDVLNQLAGDFAYYFIEPPGDARERFAEGEELLGSLGFQAGLVDGEAFLGAFEALLEVGDLASALDLEEIEGADAYTLRGDDAFDGGIALLPRAVTFALSRRVLERGLQALTRVEGASLLDGSRMQAALEENAGACFFTCVEMSPLRSLAFPELELDEAERDPFDAQLVGSVRRTPDGFELQVRTR